MFGDGLYKSEQVEVLRLDLAGLPHYVGHPATRAILDALGAEYTPGRWEGPGVGESYIAFPLARNERPGGKTDEAVNVTLDDIRVTLVTRIA